MDALPGLSWRNFSIPEPGLHSPTPTSSGRWWTRPVRSCRPSGTLTKVYIADKDSLFIHTSHDVDMKMSLPRAETAGLTVDRGDNVVLETESAGFPPNRDRDLGARPSLGDHVTALGRWIFACGREPTSQIHPLPMFESDRLEVRPALARRPAADGAHGARLAEQRSPSRSPMNSTARSRSRWSCAPTSSAAAFDRVVEGTRAASRSPARPAAWR